MTKLRNGHHRLQLTGKYRKSVFAPRRQAGQAEVTACSPASVVNKGHKWYNNNANGRVLFKICVKKLKPVKLEEIGTFEKSRSINWH
jgi:hypothetical protein